MPRRRKHNPPPVHHHQQQVHTGPRGGQYILGPNNHKIYIRKGVKPVQPHSDGLGHHHKRKGKGKNKQTAFKHTSSDKEEEEGEAENDGGYSLFFSETKHHTKKDKPSCDEHDHQHRHIRTLGEGSFGSVSQVCVDSHKSRTPRKGNRNRNKKPNSSPSCKWAEKVIVFANPHDNGDDEENQMSFRKEVYYNQILQSHRKRPKIVVELKEARMCDEKVCFFLMCL